MLKLLSIGQFLACGESNTCLHRNWALHKLGNVIDIDSTLPKNKAFLHRVYNFLFVKYSIPVRFYFKSLNNEILSIINHQLFDIIWIDKGIYIPELIFIQIKKLQKNAIIVGYSPDNMAEHHNQTQCFLDSIKYYDYYITTKSYIVDYLKLLGCKNVMFINNAFESTFHHPYIITDEDKKRLGGSVGFIGKWEKERYESILYLAKHGVAVRVWGGGKWLKYRGVHPNLLIEDKGLFSSDYNKALSAFDISLCFLRKINFDQQTTRTMEIPACGSLLMAERTPEHEVLFKDNEEAVFFSDNKELLSKCQYYLQHPLDLKKISSAGHKRCMESGYSNYETIKRCLEHITNQSL